MATAPGSTGQQPLRGVQLRVQVRECRSWPLGMGSSFSVTFTVGFLVPGPVLGPSTDMQGGEGTEGLLGARSGSGGSLQGLTVQGRGSVLQTAPVQRVLVKEGFGEGENELSFVAT